jgi:hypothetical protein
MGDIVQGFKAFGFDEKAKQVELFIKGIGVKQQNGEIVFYLMTF